VSYGTPLWQVGDSDEQNGTFKVECKKSKSDTVTAKIRAGLPATLERIDIVRTVHVPLIKSFARVDTNKRAIAARGWGTLNYIMLDHSVLQETKDRVRSIKDIYEQQVNDGVDIAEFTSLNTDIGAMGRTMDMFLDHKVEDNALRQLSAAAKKEKRRQTDLARKDGGDRVSAGLQVITDGYTIGPECLAWDRITRVERERKEIEKLKAGVLAIHFLKEEVKCVIQKGPDPQAEKLNNHDLKV
jgi:hypothetical protein